MYKKVEDIFNGTDSNRADPTPTSVAPSQPAPQKAEADMTEADKIRAMGDKLSAIWDSK